MLIYPDALFKELTFCFNMPDPLFSITLEIMHWLSVITTLHSVKSETEINIFRYSDVLMELLTFCLCKPVSYFTYYDQDKMTDKVNIFKLIFVNENVYIFIQFPLKFVPNGLTDNKSALVEAVTPYRSGDTLPSNPKAWIVQVSFCSCFGQSIEARG